MAADYVEKKPEIEGAPEAAPDYSLENLPASPDEGASASALAEEVVATPAIPAPEAAPPVPEKDPIMRQIEDILSDDLLSLYVEMPPLSRAEFKAKGEEAAGKIRKIIDSAAIVAKDILEVIVDWLKTIPGVNKFFLEQEAKIKTDKILAFAEEQKKKQI